jgi:biopolymer transport protein ExbD
MQFESFRREPPAINLSALVDVLFILVIFVVLVANFQRVRDLDVQLPAAHAQGEADPSALVVAIPREGGIRVGGEMVARDELRARLAARRADHEAILVVADGSVALERAVDVLAEAQAAGFQAVSIATREPGR